MSTTATSIEIHELGKRDLESQRSAPAKKMGVPGLYTGALLILGIISIASLALAASLLKRVEDLSAMPTVVLARTGTPPAGYTSVGLFDGEWGPATNMPVDRSDFMAVHCGASIYLLGGLDAVGATSAAVYGFEPATQVYSAPLAPMPTARFRFGAACVAGKIYVAGGYATAADGDSGAALAAVDVYDPAANAWASTTALDVPRGDLALASAGGKLYAIGGYDSGFAAVTNVDEFDPPTATWSAKAPMLLPKGDISAAVIDGVIYVPGGWNNVFQKSLVAYTPASDAWATLPSMVHARGDKAVAALDGHLYVMGGEVWSGKRAPCAWDPLQQCDVNQIPIHACEMYNPTQAVWTSFAPLPSPTFRSAAAAAGGVIFRFGGHGAGVTAVNEVSAFLHVVRPDVYLHVKDRALAHANPSLTHSHA